MERCEIFALNHFGALASGKKFSDVVLGANGSYDMCVALSRYFYLYFEAPKHFSSYVILRKSSTALLIGQVSKFELSKESFFKLSITEYTI